MKATKKRKAPAKSPAKKGTKTEQVIALLRRTEGATITELTKATDWQPHSVRGFISGTLGKKLKLKVESSKDAQGERRYKL
jgi:uncharacterized protein DUF3489